MEELGFIQSLRRLNYHDDIILKTPTVSTGERLLAICFKNQTNINCSILEIEYPECEKHFQEIMRDLRWKAERNILALQNVKNLNGLFGLRCYSFNTVIPQDEIVQLWNAHARTVYNCNLVEMPLTVSNLLVAGEVRIFNFVENMNPLYVRKEMENCLPVAF